MGYFNAAVKGVSWVGLFRVTTRAVSLLRTIILARILTPFHFGIFGIASLILSFLEILTETGINIILLQKKENIDDYINTAWVVSIVRGVIIAILILVLAGPISVFFSSPEAREILMFVSLVPLIRGFINPAVVKFQKDLQFNKEFWFKFFVFTTDSLIAIMAGLILRSAYGLAIGFIAGAVIEVVLSFIMATPKPSFQLNKARVREVLGKGKWLTGAGIFQFMFRQGDDVIVGRLLGESSLGIYQVAYKISTLPITEVTDVFNKVTLPLYVKISDDPKRLKNAFIKTTAVISLLAAGAGTAIFLFAPFIVLTVLGPNWVDAIPVLRILAIFGMIQAISNSGYSLLLALQKNQTVIKLTFISILGLALTILPLVSKFGISGAAIAALIGSLISMPFMAYSVITAINRKK